MANVYWKASVFPPVPLTKVQVRALHFLREELFDDVDKVLSHEDDTELVREAAALAVRWWQDFMDPGAETVQIDAREGEDGLFTLFLPGSNAGELEVLQDLLRGLPDEYAAFEVDGAEYCDDDRPGAFGGFAAYITRERIQHINTGSWLGKMSAAGPGSVHVDVTAVPAELPGGSEGYALSFNDVPARPLLRMDDYRMPADSDDYIGTGEDLVEAINLELRELAAATHRGE